ncbi:putative HVA22-like protein g [Impatiens glandulifera]|uniref:putative HVA22-like protein g n=1 Tax=Impatiens glandulifera TaxID=253017 RepID=UPI001FB0D5E1|nr:putative HVA22-like protein g [Impatiens glandulifera]
MLGSFITRGLLMVVGYAYPAYECFKTVEKNRVGIEELRFWCQYWIIVAALTVFERVGDIFVSWLPLYGEMKLALFIFLWYPKTKGCGYVYTTMLRPFLAKHEQDVDQKILELRARAWDSFFHYWQNFAHTGQIKLFEMMHHVVAMSRKTEEKKEEPKNEGLQENDEIMQPSKLKKQISVIGHQGISAPPSSPISSPSFQRASLKQRQLSEKKRPPLPSALSRSMSQSSEVETIRINQQDEQTSDGVDQGLLAARSRLRRSSSKGNQDM